MKKNKKKELKKVKLGYGLIIPTPQKEDYILGGLTNLPKIVLQKDGQWDSFLPIPELQALGTETMACTVFGTLSAGEMIVKRKYTNEKNFSDRWLAWAAGITRNGADPHATAEYLRKGGTPLQERWDYTPDINTWEKFYETPPAKLLDYAKEDFLNVYSFGHEYVPADINLIKEALTYSPLGVSVYAWVENGDGIFYKPAGTRDNHWCVACGWAERDGKFLLKIFDSYDNTQKIYDGMPMIIKRFHLEERGLTPKKLTWWALVMRFFSGRNL